MAMARQLAVARNIDGEKPNIGSWKSEIFPLKKVSDPTIWSITHAFYMVKLECIPHRTGLYGHESELT